MNAVTKSIPQIINLTVLVFLIFFLFGIIGVQQFMHLYAECDVLHIDPDDLFKIKNPSIYEEYKILVVTDANDCMDYGGDWLSMDTNFNNAG
jgi:membrane-anchored glycerophosphoryl diester phosphodiesterase (GDPDase)